MDATSIITQVSRDDDQLGNYGAGKGNDKTVLFLVTVVFGGYMFCFN